jgi:ubiquitin-protein ligase
METPQIKRKTITTIKKNIIRKKKDEKECENIVEETTINPVPEHINCTFQNDNYIINYYKSNSLVADFLIRNAYAAMKSGRCDTIFEPIPDTWKPTNSETKSNAELLKVLIISAKKKELNIIDNVDSIFEFIKSSYNDLELLDKMGQNTYGLVKFILASNQIMIKSHSLLTSSDSIIINNPIPNTVNTITADTILSSIQQFKIIHTPLIEDKLKDKQTSFLYHGSPYENWYSIMRNGLKIGSKNKYFLNGASYGNGIYLSNNIHTSLGYTASRNGYIHKDKDVKILAIFEVIDNPKWHKGNTIFVVDDEDALLLRYLLVFNNDCKYDNANNTINAGIFNAINIKLNKGGIQVQEKKAEAIEKKNIVSIHNKRLMKEYQNIMKQPIASLGFSVKLAEEDNLSKWMINIFKPENEKLEKQMKQLNIDAIEIEITFKENYPIAPPFIRIVYPHFKFHSGHITVGGSLCMEMLTNQGWMPTFNIENVITQIKLAISDGGGEIDEDNYKKRYTMNEAVDSFKRVLASHGWV